MRVCKVLLTFEGRLDVLEKDLIEFDTDSTGEIEGGPSFRSELSRIESPCDGIPEGEAEA